MDTIRSHCSMTDWQIYQSDVPPDSLGLPIEEWHRNGRPPSYRPEHDGSQPVSEAVRVISQVEIGTIAVGAVTQP